MHKQPNHRLSIWALVDNDRVAEDAPTPRQRGDNRSAVRDRGLDRPKSSQIKLDDLAMLESLYDYGPSVGAVLPSKCTTSSGRSIACKTKSISKDTVHFIYDAEAIGDPTVRCDDLQLGTPIHVNLDQIGAFRGALAAQNLDGFQIAVDHDCKSMLNAKLADFAKTRGINFDETAVHARQPITRIEPDNKSCKFTDQNGAVRKGRLVNVSQVDALIKASTLPPVDARIILHGPCPRLAEVVRTFEIGFAVKFCLPIPSEEFSPAIKFSNE